MNGARILRIGYDRVRTSLKWLAVVAFVLAALALPSCTGGGTMGCAGAGTIARGWSGGAVDGDTVYLGSRDGRLVSVNMTDGSLKWAVPLETGTVTTGLGCSRVQIVAYIYGSPTISGGLIYVGGYNGRIYAFAPGKDKPREYPSETMTIKGQIVGGIAVADDKVFFGSSDGTVYAVPAAGSFAAWAEEWKTLWTFRTGAKVWSTPVFNEGTVYVGSFDKKMYALDASSGTKQWEYATEGAIIAAPVVSDGVIYLGSFDRNLYAIDAISHQLKWSYEARHGFWATPVVHAGVVYAPSLDGKVHVLAAGDGTELAEIDVKAPVSSSPVIVGDLLVLATEQSRGTGSDKAGSVIWAIDISSHQSKELARLSGEKVYAPLTIGEGSVFVHTDKDSLYSVNAVTGTVTLLSIK
jgi:outer membrane protein assembly factor BamB